MSIRWSFWLSFAIMTMATSLLISCSNRPPYSVESSSSLQAVPTINSSHSSNNAPTTNNASFSLSSSNRKSSATYTFRTHTTLSKLRHGHQEFTINLADMDRSLIIAFIGYSGPASYILSNHVNGGDVRISIGKQFWDLSLVPSDSCSLTIFSDVPTEQPGIHRMQGRFVCPTLPSGGLATSTSPAAITDGTFDVSIIVES